MKYRFAVMAVATLLAGCQSYRQWDQNAGGYGASLTMGGGSGAAFVYPDSAFRWGRMSTEGDYGIAVGGAGYGTNAISGSAASAWGVGVTNTNNVVMPAIDTNAAPVVEQQAIVPVGQEPVATPAPPPDPNAPVPVPVPVPVPAPDPTQQPPPAPTPQPQPAPAPEPQPAPAPQPQPPPAPAPQPQPAPAPQPQPQPAPQPAPAPAPQGQPQPPGSQ